MKGKKGDWFFKPFMQGHIIDPCGGFKKHGSFFLPESTITEEERAAAEWQQQYRLWSAQRWVALKNPPDFELQER